MDPKAIEAEMRRFEDEISSTTDGVPSLPPPPMFLSGEKEQQQQPGKSVPNSHVPSNPPISAGNFAPPSYEDSNQHPSCSTSAPPINHNMMGSIDSQSNNCRGLYPPMQGMPNSMPNRMNGPPGFMPRSMGPMPPMGPLPPNMGGMRSMFDRMVPMPPFIPPPVLPDFSKFLEGQAVYSSAPVLKKRKIETTETATTSKGAAVKDSAQSSKDTAPKANQEAPIAESVPTKAEHVEVNKPTASYNNTTPVITHQQQHQQQQQSTHTKAGKKKKNIRTAAGQKWEDPTLNEWDPSDYRIFCGDLGNEVTDDTLTRVFTKYPSFQKARVVRDKNTNKSRGYGFVSMKDPNDFIRAIREMNGKYVGNRPIKLRKSNWKERNVENVRKKIKEKKRLGYKV